MSWKFIALFLSFSLLALWLNGCSDDNSTNNDTPAPPTLEEKLALGKEVFRFGTFGNQRFWTDIMQLPQGIAAAGITPLAALGVGLHVNVEALSPATAKALTDALAAINAGTPAENTVLGNAAVTLTLLNENAVIGVVAFDEQGQRKPLGSADNFNPADTLDLAGGDKIGVSCALCHANTDGSVVPKGFAGLAGSVGKVQDGFIPEQLDVGTIFALAAQPQAYLPFYQLAFEAAGNASVGKGDFTGLTRAQDTDINVIRGYLTAANNAGERAYPVGTFDAFPDGVGNPTAIPYFLETKLAAPWGHGGVSGNLDDFNNLVYTVGLDPTSLVTTDGKTLLKVLAGALGEEIAERYENVLRELGALPAGVAADTVFPVIDVAQTGLPVGSSQAPVGTRVAEAELEALRLYTDTLAAPPAPSTLNSANVQQGQGIFNSLGCSGCHQANPKAAATSSVTPLATLYPAYTPTLLHDRSTAGLGTNVEADLQSAEADYSHSVSVFDAGLIGQGKGFAEPLLIGLDQRTVYLHDGRIRGNDSQSALMALLDPARGMMAAHPFYVSDPNQRAQLAEYLRSRNAR